MEILTVALITFTLGFLLGYYLDKRPESYCREAPTSDIESEPSTPE